DEHYKQVEEMTRRLDMCEDVQVLTARDGIRRLVDSFYVVDYLLICNTWKPSRDFTRPLGSPSGLKGLLHTLNATVIPTKVYDFGISISCSYTGNAQDEVLECQSSCKEASRTGLVGCFTGY
ncbi:hypothetical protein Tco_1087174, partial [Tanacetum coccineum]